MNITYITAISATLENNSNTILVSGENVDFSKANDYLVALDNGLYVLPVLSGTAPDENGNSTLTLVKNWTGATLSNKGLFIFPTFAKIYESVTAMTALNDVTRGILTKLKDLLTDTNPTLNISVGKTSSIETIPYGYLVNQVTGLIAQLNGLLGSVQAMTKAEFDRARFNDLNAFPVAGTYNIDFDTSFEFQQVDGWQNKFRVKANKTRIDGVWHDYDDTDIVLNAAPNGLQNKDLVSADFANLAAAIVAGGDSLSQSYLNQRHFVYIVQEDIAVPNVLSTAYIQDAKNNIYSDDGVLRQRVVSFVADRILESVEIQTSKTWTNTVNCMYSLGWTLSADIKGQWEKDGKKAVGLVVVSSRNQGAYHPIYNSEGCTAWHVVNSTLASRYWHQDDSLGLIATTTSECFDLTKINETATGFISGTSYRPDAKFYDAIYASDVKDLRMSTAKKSAKTILSLYDSKAKAGEVRGFDGVPFLKKVDTATSTSSGNTTYYPTNFPESYSVGDLVYIQTTIPDFYHKARVKSVDETGFYFYPAAVSRADYAKAVHHKFKTQQQSNHVWMDVFGKPSNVISIQGQWNSEVPTGVSQSWKLNRKAKSSTLLKSFRTVDNGTSWLDLGTIPVNQVSNSIAYTMPENAVDIHFYETQAHFTDDASSSRVVDLGDVYGSSQSYTPSGDSGLLTSSLIGKVALPQGANYRAKNVHINAYKLTNDTQELDPYLLTEHDPLELSPSEMATIKTLSYLSHENLVAKLCYAYKEMIFDGTWGDNNRFEIADNQSNMTDDNGNNVLFGTASFETQYFISEE